MKWSKVSRFVYWINYAGNIENKFAALDREKESNKFEIFKHVLGEILYEKNPQELIAGM